MKTAQARTAIPAPLREAELHTLWLDQRFPPDALVTLDGEPVRVLYRGRPGTGPGPDFRDARVGVGGAPPRLGDVELHVAAPDFRHPHHALDDFARRLHIRHRAVVPRPGLRLRACRKSHCEDCEEQPLDHLHYRLPVSHTEALSLRESRAFLA